MKGNYIGNNPNGLDFVLVDNKTTIEKNKKIVSKDIAINGDDTDLASERGIFNAVSKENVDYNTLVDQGVYAVANTGSTNGPGYAAKVLVCSVKGSAFITQIAVGVDRNTITWRYKTESATWTPWKKIILETDVASTSKSGIVQLNDTTSSTSTSQAATANAVKLAYDKAVAAYTKAVAAYTKAESAQGSSASADKLTTARTIQTNLASTASASFDGTENVTPGVTGVLPAANGGTGRTDGKAPSLVTKRTIDGVNFDGSANIHHYGTCSTDAGTAAKTVTLANFVLATGAIAFIRFTVTNTASSPTLNINSTGAKAIRYRNAGIPAGYLAANRTYRFVYDGSSYELVGDVDTNTTYTAASAAPKAPGTAAVGTSTKYAREDHVHPLQTTVSGNAGSATKLATARTIDGVSFNGTANITHFGKCSTEAATAAKTVSVTGFTLATGAEVTVQFTVTNTAASPTLNVNNTGAKAIVYRNAAISAGYLAANRVYKFVYDGTNYELIGDIDTNTKYTAASATPKAPGTAAVGTSSKYAREDHIHPLQTTVSGNAGSATKLATARTIGITGVVTGTATAFDGSKNITIDTTTLNLEDTGVTGELPIAHGGTGRTDGKAAALVTARTISLTGVVTGSASFDGSENISIATKSDGIGGNIPIGGIIAFSGTFGGTDNRFPIPLGSSEPDTNWCLCDGTTTNGKKVPDLRNKMIMGAGATYKAGTTGGSDKHSHSISGSVGQTTLTVEQLANHSHTQSFYDVPQGPSSNSKNAMGQTSMAGDYKTQSAGSNSSHSHTMSKIPTSSSSNLPPYYALSYIIKIS